LAVENKNNVQTYLKKFREKTSMTQEELAEKLEISRQSVISLESGKCVPSVHLALRISQFFDVPVEFIFRSDFENHIENIENIENENNLNGGGQMSRDMIPWSPWRDLLSLRETMDKFFDEPHSVAHQPSGMFLPAVSIRDSQGKLVIEIDIPGVKEEDLDVRVEDDKVIVRGERKHTEENKRDDYYHLESSYGAFSRVIALPSSVNADRAEAEVKNGILEIRIPKVDEKKTKKIEVKSPAKSSVKTVKMPKKD